MGTDKRQIGESPAVFADGMIRLLLDRIHSGKLLCSPCVFMEIQKEGDGCEID
jgi:hypothetical protein